MRDTEAVNPVADRVPIWCEAVVDVVHELGRGCCSCQTKKPSHRNMSNNWAGNVIGYC